MHKRKRAPPAANTFIVFTTASGVANNDLGSPQGQSKQGSPQSRVGGWRSVGGAQPR